MAMVFMIGSMLAFSSLCGVTLGTQFAECGPSLSNECANFILEDPRGPQMMLLAMELAKNDPPNAPKVSSSANNKTLRCSLNFTNRHFIKNHWYIYCVPNEVAAIRKELSVWLFSRRSQCIYSMTNFAQGHLNIGNYLKYCLKARSRGEASKFYR